VAVPLLTVWGVPIWDPLAKNVTVPVGDPLLATLAVIVTGVVGRKMVLPAQLVVTVTEVLVAGVPKYMPDRGNVPFAPFVDITWRVPWNTAPVRTPVGVAVIGSRQSSVVSLLTVQVAVPSEKFDAPAVRV
jgi:hypothetical protein